MNSSVNRFVNWLEKQQDLQLEPVTVHSSHGNYESHRWKGKGKPQFQKLTDLDLDELKSLKNKIDIKRLEGFVNSTSEEEWENVNFIFETYDSLDIVVRDKIKFLETGDDRHDNDALNMARIITDGDEISAVAFIDSSNQYGTFDIQSVVVHPELYKKPGNYAGNKMMIRLLGEFLSTDLKKITTFPMNDHVEYYYSKLGFKKRAYKVGLEMDRKTAEEVYNKFKRFIE